MNTSQKNYYEILEVNVNSTSNEINEAYTRAKNTYNSENSAMYSLLTKDECESILSQIEEAYSVIGSVDKKKQYDEAKGFIVKTHTQTPQTNIELSDDFKYQSVETKKESVTVSKNIATNKFSLEFTKDEEFERQIEQCECFTGDFLKSIREYKNVSIEKMSDITRISKTYLKHIESDNVEKLPARVYTRGFVYQYAKFLRLNPDLVAKSYLDHCQELTKVLNG
ncbi:MAG: helix-turn-helix domain-containing protein [Bacteriovoracaceae bacterium]|jgi:curved DNA-binding protein CbpA|nr:helix-turn-helix domain-containing protein [Bacteriovoracaceae bacterium]